MLDRDYRVRLLCKRDNHNTSHFGLGFLRIRRSNLRLFLLLLRVEREEHCIETLTSDGHFGCSLTLLLLSGVRESMSFLTRNRQPESGENAKKEPAHKVRALVLNWMVMLPARTGAGYASGRGANGDGGAGEHASVIGN